MCSVYLHVNVDCFFPLKCHLCFFFKDPDLQVKVIRKDSSNSWAQLSCHSSCHRPDRSSYVWYRNGKKIQGETSSSYSDYFSSSDSYSCAVRGQEAFPSPPVCEFASCTYTLTSQYSNNFKCNCTGILQIFM